MLIAQAVRMPDRVLFVERSDELLCGARLICLIGEGVAKASPNWAKFPSESDGNLSTV